MGALAFSVLGRLNAERFIRALLLAFLVSYFHCNPSSVLAAEWYVDAGVATSGDGKTWETAFQTIQEGIDAAWDGDIVIVGEGVYYENIRFHGRNIVLRSRNPRDSDVIGNTIIDGNQAGSVVTFSGREDASCAIGGFTIRNGVASYGGGIRSEYPWRHSQARIEKNVIYGNSATCGYNHGGGAGYCDGKIEGNTIWGNTADCGGGLACCNGEIRNNVILRNAALEQGGGLYCCDGAIENNAVTENKAVGDSEAKGGGLYECNGTIQNNTIVGNSAPEGGGLYGCEGTISNCIIWGNSARTGDQLIESREPTYSCIEGWMREGQGNIFVAPHFVDAGRGDYHLRSWSPCIDAGDPASPFSTEPEPNGERVNMGAYGNTREAAAWLIVGA